MNDSVPSQKEEEKREYCPSKLVTEILLWQGSQTRSPILIRTRPTIKTNDYINTKKCMLKDGLFYFKVFRIVTADGIKILLEASGTLYLLPDGSRWNDWWRGWEESAVIIVAFLITEQLYRSDGRVCRQPHILLAWFTNRDSLVTREGCRFNLQPFCVESLHRVNYNRVPFNDM